MKRCNTCGDVKELVKFYARKSAKDGRDSQCKACKEARNREWTKDNSDKLYVIAAKWRKDNPDKVNASSAKWRRGNPDKVSARNAKWREDNPESGKDYYHKRKDESPISVYLLPNENYVGVTSQPIEGRIAQHKTLGRDVEGYKILSTHQSAAEGLLEEARLHSEGYGGKSDKDYSYDQYTINPELLENAALKYSITDKQQ